MKQSFIKGIIITLPVLATLWLPVTPAHAQANLVGNGSFETAGGSLNDWSVYFAYPNVGVGTGVTTNAPDGSHIAYFEYYGGGISQVLSTTPGTYYMLSLAAIEGQGTNNFYVSAGSLSATLNFTSTAPIFPVNGSNVVNTIWETFNFSFLASSTNTLLSFSCQPQFAYSSNYPYYPYWGSVGLDAVTVIAVPEPATVVLLGAGLAGGLACRRRAQSKR